MTNEKIEIIYEILTVGLPLTEEVLSLYGFAETEIKELVNKGILKAIAPQKYTLSDTDGLYKFGIKQLLTQHIKIAIESFRRCYQIDPTNRDACLQLFILELKKGNYYGSHGIFDIIERINPEEYQKDNNLYLYLLNIIFKCKEEERERALNITLEDVLISNEDTDPDKEMENIIRKNILKEKYKPALTLLNDLIAKKGVYVTKYIVLKELISQVINREEIMKEKIFNATKEKKYTSLIYYLEAKARRKTLKELEEDEIVKYLNQTEARIYLIAKAIVDIKETRILLTRTKDNFVSLDDAIKSNDFEAARRINISYLKYRKRIFEEDVIYLLLEDMNNFIKEIKDEQTRIALNELLFSGIGTKKSEVINNPYESIKMFSNEESIVEDKEMADSFESLSYEEEIAHSIKETNMSLNEAVKSLGLFKEQILLIKLVYVRDYYIEGTDESYELGDRLLQEVENSIIKTDKVERIISELKENKYNYKNTNKENQVSNPFTRKKTKQ